MWHESPSEVAALVRWLIEVDLWSVSDACRVIEKPWHFEDEYLEMKQQEPAV